MAGDLVYLDSSALVKLVVREAESQALRAYLGGHPVVVSSALAVTEVHRAIARVSPRRSLADRARLVLDGVALLGVELPILEKAARLAPLELRSLDAIHLASALSLGEDLLAFVTYDDRQAASARRVKVPVVRPAATVE